MNKPRLREGFVADDEPIDVDIPAIESPKPTFDNEEEVRPEKIARPARSAEPPLEEESAEPARPSSSVVFPFTYKLRYRPLKMSRGEEIKELTFREPSARDILDFGNPVNIEVKQSGKQMSFDIHIDDNKMMQVLGNLCTDKRIQSAHLGDLDLRDFTNIANKLRRFFRPDWDMVNF